MSVPKPDMATIEGFESMLKEVVTAKRLSASKTEKLTEVSMKLMENDTQIVSILYRTHKSLRASAKISSLYVFDAICRAARSQVNKRNLSGDINAEKGNCATFLLKIDSVLDGLFQDIISSGIPEAKEKTKKVLDIWTKRNTFPANVLARLGAVSKVDESSEASSKETKTAVSDTPMPTSDPRKQPTPPNVITPPPAANTTTPTAEAAQAALLALLTSAAVANNPSNANQVSGNTANVQSIPPPQAQSQAHLGQLQLALLQQLSKNNNGVSVTGAAANLMAHQAVPIFTGAFNTGTSPIPTLLNMTTGTPNLPGPSTISPANNGAYPYQNQGSRDPRPGRFGNTQINNGRAGQYFDNERRGGFRGRGRGDFRVPIVREQEDLPRDRGSSSHQRGQPTGRRRYDSRSRSPPPRRTDKGPPYSPPRQDSLVSPVDRIRPQMPGALEPGKDEFGRDIRVSSEEPEADRAKTGDVAMEPRGRGKSPIVPNETSMDRSRHVSVPNDNFDASRAQISNSSAGLESFDISTFDLTNAASWQALGNAFQVTHGYVPSQEELMQLVMTSMSMMMDMGVGVGMDMNIGVDNLDAATGMSEASFGNAEGDVADPGSSSRGTYARSTDAVVLGPNAEDPPLGKEMSIDTKLPGSNVSATSGCAASPPSSSGGKMVRVGNGWKFVRDGV